METIGYAVLFIVLGLWVFGVVKAIRELADTSKRSNTDSPPENMVNNPTSPARNKSEINPPQQADCQTDNILFERFQNRLSVDRLEAKERRMRKQFFCKIEHDDKAFEKYLAKLEKKKHPIRDAYYAYLDSDKWKATREDVLKRAKYKCEICHESPAEQVHHTSYPEGFKNLDFNEGEDLSHLIAICDNCHGKIHDFQNRKNSQGKFNLE